MPGATATQGFPYPALTDDPNVPADVQALAEVLDANITAIRTGTTGVQPLSDGSNSVWLSTASDKPLPQSTVTELLTKTITLTRTQNVILGAKARLSGGGALPGLVGIHITMDGAVLNLGTAGPVSVLNGANDNRADVSIPLFVQGMDAGSHVIKLWAAHNADGVIDAATAFTFQGVAYKPTSLTIIV